MIKNKIRKKNDKIKIIWFFISSYKLYFICLLGLAILIGMLESLNVGLMYPIIYDILGDEASGNTFLSFIDPYINRIPINDSLVRYATAFLMVSVFVFIFKAVYYYFSVGLSAKVVKKTKQDVFNKCITSDYQFFVDKNQGEIFYRTVSAPATMANMLAIFSEIFISLFLSISVIVILFSMSWKLVIMLFIAGGIYLYIVKYISTVVSYKAGEKQRIAGEKEAAIVTEYTSGIKQIKVFETYEYWKGAFDKTLNTFWHHYKKNYFWTRLPEIMLWLVVYVAIGSSIIIIKLQYPGKFMSLIPLLATFAFGIFIILPKISQFGRFRMSFMHLLPNVEIVYKMLKDKSYTKIKNGNKKFSKLKKGLTLKNVTFSHKERGVLLDGMNLEIKKDKTTALVGPSGSGKSTIVNLLLRLYDADKGGLYIDDINIKEYDIFSFLKKIGFVSQDTFIFNSSIRDNIAFGEQYTDQEVLEAAKSANAHEFIQKMPEGYNTIVGDRGLRLSGGEKQRLAIARAIIRKPEILILDEATSSLDNVSESIVQQAINKVSKNCTTFIIAHRLSTIKNADMINVLDNGKIIESGSHSNLLKKKGKYWELNNIQKE